MGVFGASMVSSVLIRSVVWPGLGVVLVPRGLWLLLLLLLLRVLAWGVRLLLRPLPLPCLEFLGRRLVVLRWFLDST